jgi:GDP-4-dehydro-6-deoxy-D-mannose reductase
VGPVLVVGASGFLGSAVLTELTGRGLDVTGTSTGGGDLAGLDLLDADTVRRVFREVRPAAIVALAGRASVAASWHDPPATFRLNTRGVASLLEACERHAPGARFVLASTGAVYGSPASAIELPFLESHPVRPESPYAASKAAAEVLCGEYGRRTGAGVAVLRMFNLVGPGQSPSQTPSGFAREIARAEASGAPELSLEIRNPGAARDFTDVRDAAAAVRIVLEQEANGTFNLAGGRTATIEELVRLLAGMTRVEVGTVRGAPTRPNDTPVVTGSAGRLRTETGWKPEIELGRSLADLLTWWRDLV